MRAIFLANHEKTRVAGVAAADEEIFAWCGLWI